MPLCQLSCGWSHTVVRGVRPDGSLVFYGWGRRDLGQLPRDVNLCADPKSRQLMRAEVETCDVGVLPESSASYSQPHPLPLPPYASPEGSLFSGQRSALQEVWCAGEGIWACCAERYLWYSGWNEHGNLGWRRGTSLSPREHPTQSSPPFAKVPDTREPSRPRSKGQRWRNDAGDPCKIVSGADQCKEGIPKSDGSVGASCAFVWTPVLDENGAHCRLPCVWDGLVGFGGGHTLALVSPR